MLVRVTEVTPSVTPHVMYMYSIVHTATSVKLSQLGLGHVHLHTKWDFEMSYLDKFFRVKSTTTLQDIVVISIVLLMDTIYIMSCSADRVCGVCVSFRV
jgi:hypothetical protein